ncbi:MAG: glycoside hydrolase family 125 protein, partial [Chloroflexota bacterium]
EREYYLVEDVVPFIRLTFQNGVVAECLTYATLDTPIGIAQDWRFSKAGISAQTSGVFWLQKSQSSDDDTIVENPVPDTVELGEVNRTVHYATYTHLPASFVVQSRLEKNKKHNFVAIQKNRLGSSTRAFTLSFGLAHEESYARAAQRAAASLDPGTLLTRWKKRWQRATIVNGVELPQKRAMANALRSFVPIDDEAVAMATDTDTATTNRDAYYMAAPMLNWSYETRHLVRGHLVWLFDRAKREDGQWSASYTPDGEAKNTQYVLDQQIYPLLLLADYTLQTGDKELFGEFQPLIDDTLTMLDTRADNVSGLLPASDADDLIDSEKMPYDLPTHVLLWQALNQLENVEGTGEYAKRANNLQSIIDEHFLIERDGKPMFAYATDGEGNHTEYSDPNDIPLLLMPEWDYVDADNPAWRNTVQNAQNTANARRQLDAPDTPADTQTSTSTESTTAPPPPEMPVLLSDATLSLAQMLNTDVESLMERIRTEAQWDGALPQGDTDPDAQS